ncbi:MAG: SPOR domain-containing protein [Saprospiraceae bacterium]|nr:SPOR domain-containing protein [Saprospiraceae bacterium]
MARLIRVILYAIVVLILYFWVTSLLKSYQDNNNRQNPSQVVQDSLNTTMDTSDIQNGEDILTNDDLVNSDKMYENLDKAIDQLAGEAEPKTSKPQVTQQKNVVSPDKEKKENVVKTNTTGPYMVIAGSFIKEENAKIQLKKLKTFGYNSAEIKIFVASEYHSVIVSRHGSESEAELVVQDLRNKGVESFVKQKQ